MHAIVKQEHETGWVFVGNYFFARSPSQVHSFSLTFLRYVFMLLCSLSSLFVLSRSIYRRLYSKTHCQKDKGESFASFLFVARLCWYVQKKERNTVRNEIAQEHVQWGKFFARGKIFPSMHIREREKEIMNVVKMLCTAKKYVACFVNDRNENQ